MKYPVACSMYLTAEGHMDFIPAKMSPSHLSFQGLPPNHSNPQHASTFIFITASSAPFWISVSMPAVSLISVSGTVSPSPYLLLILPCFLPHRKSLHKYSLPQAIGPTKKEYNKEPAPCYILFASVCPNFNAAAYSL